MCAVGGLLCQNLGGQGHPLPHMSGGWGTRSLGLPGRTESMSRPGSRCPCLGRAWGRGREPDLAEALRSEAMPLENQRFP